MPSSPSRPGRCVVARASLTVLVIISFERTAPAAQESAGEKQPPQPAAVLSTLNNASRGLYAQARARVLAKEGPVIILIGDDLVLRNRERREQAKVIPETYHTLK